MSIKKGSFWLSALENIVELCPTLAIVLYSYFSELEQTVSWSSKLSFGMALSLLIIFLVYSRVFKNHLASMRQALVQSETDLKNGVGDPTKVSENIASYKLKLETLSRAKILIVLFILALSIYILEQATIGLLTMITVAVASVAAGMGIHVAVIKLEEKENKNGGKESNKK